MTLYWIPGLIAIVIVGLADWVIFKRLKRAGCTWARVHAGAALCLYALLAVAVSLPSHRCTNAALVAQMWMLYIFFAMSVCKLLTLGIYSLSWIGRQPRWLKTALRVVAAAAGVAAVVECGVGAWVTPYRTQVTRVTIESDRLPAAFDGYRVVQFSDLHLGTYNGDTRYVSRCVDQINSLHPDLLCFTGDIENRLNSEVLPFKHILSRLHARDGVWAVRGNHDVGGYYDWPTKHITDYQGGIALTRMEESLGWTMLNNRYRYLSRGGSKIALIGLDGYGGLPIPPDGNLGKVYPAHRDSLFKIVLHHSPELWNDAFNRATRVDLILCGHTHAMQMIFDIMGHRFSPAMFQYPQWGGLYTDGGGQRHIYVNTGLGQVGIPARLGNAVPEITLITLRRKP